MTLPAHAISEGPLTTARLTVHHLAVARPGSPRVLLLGGSNFDLRLKRAFLKTGFAQTCDLVTYEPRGIGRTDQPDGVWRMQDYAKDALSVLDTMGWDKAFVVGESFGGMTALHLASLSPDRVAGLVIASATAGGAMGASYDIAEFLSLPIDAAAEAALCLQDTRNHLRAKDDPAHFAALMKDRIAFETAFRDQSTATEGYSRLLDARRGHDSVAALRSIQTPTTVIAGRFDAQAKPDAQRTLAKALPNATFHLFDAGHGVLFADRAATSVALAAVHEMAETIKTAS